MKGLEKIKEEILDDLLKKQEKDFNDFVYRVRYQIKESIINNCSFATFRLVSNVRNKILSCDYDCDGNGNPRSYIAVGIGIAEALKQLDISYNNIEDHFIVTL